jgi:hypothetical protein
VGTDQNGTLTATYNGSSQSTNLSLAATVVISSVQCNPATLGPNATTNCIVTLSNAAPTAGVLVALSTTGLPGLTVPASTVVTAGSTTGPFTASTGALAADQNGTLTASYQGSAQTVNLSLAATTVVSALQCNPTTIGANSSSNCTVTLSKNVAAGGSVIALNSSGLPALAVPASVSVAEGSTAAFTVVAGPLSADQNGTLTATLNGTSQTINLSLAVAAVVSSLQCSPTTLGANSSSTCTVTLSKPAPAGGAVVMLSTAGLPGLVIPATVTVQPGSTTVQFTAATGAVVASQNGTVAAAYNGVSQTVNMSLSANTVISSVQCSPTTLTSNTMGNCTVTLSAPVNEPANIPLSTTLPNILVPPVAIVPAGVSTATFSIFTLNITENVTGPLTLRYNGSSQSVTLNLVAQ